MRSINLKHIRSTLDSTGYFVLSQIRKLLDENPDATAADVRDYLAEIFTSSRNISEDEERPGHYRLLRGRRESSVWLRETLVNRLSIEVGRTSHDEDANPRILDIEQMGLMELAHIAQIQLRTAALRSLSCVVNNPHSTEEDLQHALEGNLWIFGGAYSPKLGRRRLVKGTELDIPLVRPDGSLQVVELKRANVNIVTRQRGGLIPNGEVHRAVGQVMNYLVTLDEDRLQILDQYGIDIRRAHATVIVGHPRFQSAVGEVEIDAVLRTYNSHLARVEVITYKQLLESAHKVLTVDDSDGWNRRGQVADNW